MPCYTMTQFMPVVGFAPDKLSLGLSCMDWSMASDCVARRKLQRPGTAEEHDSTMSRYDPINRHHSQTKPEAPAKQQPTCQAA